MWMCTVQSWALQAEKPSCILIAKKAVLVVDTHMYGSGGTIITFPTDWKDAMAYVPFLPAILMRTYGEGAKIWLTEEGRIMAAEMQWNLDTSLPIPDDKMLLMELEDKTPTWSRAQITNLDILKRDNMA